MIVWRGEGHREYGWWYGEGRDIGSMDGRMERGGT